MTTYDRPVAIGVFQNDAQAQEAIYDLQQDGFTNEQIRYSQYKPGLSILDGLVGLGFTHIEASFYQHEYEHGHTVVTVRTPDRQEEAFTILNRHAGYTIEVASENGQHTVSPQTMGSRLDQSPQNILLSSPEDEYTMQLRGEDLQVQKQWVQTEEIRIRRKVITEEKTFTVPVRREEIIIERFPFGSTPTNEELNEGTDAEIVTLADGETIKIRVREERVQIETIPMIVEEVYLTKRIVTEARSITETVQHEEPRIERTGNVTISGDVPEDAYVETSPTE